MGHEIWSTLDPDGRSIVMLCGAKNNGKSLLLRHLVNSYNSTNSSSETKKKPISAGAQNGSDNQQESSDESDIVMMDHSESDNSHDDHDVYAYFIDCDPGQSELTTPGIVSAHIIRASAPPLQSPTYLNVGQHELIMMSSVGGTNMSVNPRMYIENSRFVYNKVIEHRDKQTVKRPIFINTMGHIRNVGLAMLMDLIKICQPTNLIVLNIETDPMRTIYADLSPKAIDKTRASFHYETNQQQQHTKLNYKYDIYNLQFSFIDSSSVATKNRTALQLAYMATIPEALYKPIMQLNTKWVSFKKVSVYCVSSYPLKEAIVLELLHHSWIHLVKLRHTTIQQHPHSQVANNIGSATAGQQPEHKNDEVICRILDDVTENTLYGCGIVSDIDLEKKLLAVITPIDQATIDEHVDCIIKPLSIQVPHQMLQEGYCN